MKYQIYFIEIPILVLVIILAAFIGYKLGDRSDTERLNALESEIIDVERKTKTHVEFYKLYPNGYGLCSGWATEEIKIQNNQAIQLILDHLNMKIKWIPEKTEVEHFILEGKGEEGGE